MTENEIIEKYQYLVPIIARAYFLAGAETEDLCQEGRIGLLNAGRSYKDSEGVQFTTYASRCIKNAILDAVARAQGDNNNILSTAEPLENLDYVGIAENGLEDKVHYKALLEQFLQGVAPEDKKVVKLFLQGFKYDEIAKELSMKTKAVDNIIQKIRKKHLADM